MKVSKLAVRLDVPPSDGGLNVPMRLTRGDVHIIFKLRAWPVSDIGNECLHMPTHQHAVTDGCAQDINRRASLGTVPQESSHLAGHCIARKEVQVWHVQVDRLHLWGPAHARIDATYSLSHSHSGTPGCMLKRCAYLARASLPIWKRVHCTEGL